MRIKFLIILLLIGSVSFAQKSPPCHVEGVVNKTKVVIDYSSPRVRDRIIYGNLVPFDEIWRAGANKNTTVEFNNDVKVNGKKLNAGKYGFFIIPTKNNEWTVIFNKKNDAWGAFSYNEEEDALRIKVKINFTKELQEELTYSITKKGINFMWEKVSFTLQVE